MPYQSIREIPKYVRDALDERDQQAWLAAFNAAWSEYGDEETAFQVAANAVDLDEQTANGAAAELGFVNHAEQVDSAPKKYNHIDFVPPKAAQQAAQQVLDWREEYGDEVTGMTRTGWIRANQIASGEPLSPDVVKRMAQFKRFQEDKNIADKYEGTPWRDNGYVAWLGWGDDAGILEFAPEVVSEMDEADKQAENGANAQAVGLDDQEHNFQEWQVISHAKAEGEWLPLYPFGPVEHPGHPDGEYEVDTTFFENMKEAFDHFAGHNWFPPIQGSHAKDGDDKARPEPHPKAWGIISDIRLNDGVIEGYHQHTSATQKLIDDGALLYRSPTHALELKCTTCKDSDGEFKRFNNVLTEVSYVRRPQITNLGMGSAANHYVLHESQDESPFIKQEDVNMADEKNETQETPAEESGDSEVEHMDMEEKLGMIMEKLEDMDQRLSNVENMYGEEDDTDNGGDMEQGKQPDDTDEDVEHGNVDDRILQLEHKLLEVERDKARTELRSKLGEVDDELVEVLVGLDDDDRAKVVEHMKADEPEGDDKGTTVFSHGRQSQGGSSSRDVDTRLEHARKTAEEQGIESTGPEFTRWLKREDRDLYTQAYR